MAKRSVLKLFLVSVAIVGTTICTSCDGQKEIIRDGVGNGFIYLNESGMNTIDSEVENLKNQKDTIQSKQAELRGIESHIESYIKQHIDCPTLYFITRDYSPKCHFDNGEDSLSTHIMLYNLGNEYFDVADASIDDWEWTRYLNDIALRGEKTTITVKEKETNITHDISSVQDILSEEALDLGAEISSKVKIKQKSSMLLNGVLSQKDAWEIRKISEEVYSVSGYGLGYYEGQLSIGEWYYYEDYGDIEPITSSSKRLKDVIMCNSNNE